MTSMLAVAVALAFQGQALYEEQFIFEPRENDHVHASCIVECPNGDLRAVWYENGTPLPAPYFSEQKDKSDDVRIGGARKPAGADDWEPAFVMHDTFGVSDDNPCMVIDANERLWLIHPTLTAVPEWTWGSALLQYMSASHYDHPGAPKWDMKNILLPHIPDLRAAVKTMLPKTAEAQQWPDDLRKELTEEFEEALANPLIDRLGWMPRAHPLIRSDGALVLPISNENFEMALMAITKDAGATWTYSAPVPELGLTQPTLVEFSDGEIVAFFRNDAPERRIRRSESHDGGMTWGPITVTDRPHPGAGIEAIGLGGDGIMMIYNDKEDDPRDKLAVSISTDRGKTWPWTRHLEDTPGGRFDYPSLVRGKDGAFHATYSYNLKTVKYVHFNTAWVKEGD